jgi:hypothetical protein
VVVVVEDFADAAACSFGDFASSLGGADSDVFSGSDCSLAYVSGGLGGVEGYEISGTFADALACRSCSLGGSLADVAGSAASLTAGALGLGLRLGLGGWLGLWGLGVLGGGVLGGDGYG